VPVGGPLNGLLGFLIACAILCALTFALAQASVIRIALVCSVSFVAAGFALWSCHGATAQRLLWDGKTWHWSDFPADSEIQVTPVIALASCVCVRITDADGRLAWAWLERRTDAPRWPALRRALAFQLGL